MNEPLDHFLERVFWTGFVALILIIAGIFFGPWEISKDSVTLLLIISNPTSAAFGARMTRAGIKP